MLPEILKKIYTPAAINFFFTATPSKNPSSLRFKCLWFNLCGATQGLFMIEDISSSRGICLNELTDIWENSVRATHDFLTESDIVKLKPLAIDAIKEIPKLYCVRENSHRIDGFMGIDGDKLEMLFIRDSKRGHGLGKSLLRHGIEALGVRHADVNEQNPQARGFYEHLGFSVFKRSEHDGQGNPFPILHMRLGDRFERGMLAYCGLHCEQCSARTAYLRQDWKHLDRFPAKYQKERLGLKDYDCECCKGRNLCGPCRIKDCAAPRGIDSCADCADFPCRFLDEFENDGMPHHRQAIANLREIRAHGADAWFKNLQPPLRCHCGERQSWYCVCPKHN